MMDEPPERQKPDPGENIRSPREPAASARPWTQEEMDAAEPVPMPEVDDGDGSPRISGVRLSHDQIFVGLTGGETVVVPLAGLPRLLGAPEEKRNGWSIVGDGTAVRWPELGEELSLETVLRHRPG